ncbi:unnamed protein product [Closterium sp. NIES-54]
MEVARNSMIHAAAPHFLCPFAVRYVVHQLNLWPRFSLPETSPTLRWTRKVGDVLVFRVWGSRAFVRDTFADKLSTRAIPYVFLGFSPDAHGYQFYHPTLRRVFHSQDVTFDELVSFNRLFPYHSAPPPPPPLFLAPGPPPVDPLPHQVHAPSGVSQVDPLPSTAPVEVAFGSGAAPSAASEGAASGGAEPGGAEFEGVGLPPHSLLLLLTLIHFVAACRLDYATPLVAESASASLPSIGGECALGTDFLEDSQEDFECLAAAIPRFASMLLAPEGDLDAPDIPTPRSYAEAITGPYSSQWQATMDAEMASWKSIGTYVDTVPPQRHGVDFFQTFYPTPKMTTLWVLLHVAAQRDYEVHSLDFSIAFLQGSLHEEIWLRRPPGFTGSFPAGTQWSLRRPVYGLLQVPREWRDTLRTTLAALGFAPSTADPSLFLRSDTSLPPFYLFVYVDDLVFATGDTKALTLVKSELQKRHTCTNLGELRSSLGLQITRDRARHTITLTQSDMVHQVLQRFGF